MFVCFVTPYRISFYDSDTPFWVIIDSIVDVLFFIDIILNFFMAYYDSSDEIVDDRKLIAFSYLSRWFFLDLISIIPISFILDTNRNFNTLARVSRLPKLYRLIRVLRLMKIAKIVKERGNLINQVNSAFSLDSGFERFIFFVIFTTIICHVVACFW